MIEVGRLCIKIAGRDAGKKAVIIDILDDKYVFIDGETRRRKVNILHLEPLSHVLKINKGDSHEEVAKALDELGLKARSTKPRQKAEKPKKKRKTPEQLRTQKEEKKKLRDLFKFKKEYKAEQKEDESLEKKAGLKIEETKEDVKDNLKIIPVREAEIKEEKQEIKAETKPVKEKEAKKKTDKK